jgi:F-type H+-transporting ATPase subunit b
MGLITPDIGLVFWMLVTFGIVLFILGKFAWKPILKALGERENSIAEALDKAEEAKKQMASLKADNEKLLAQARTEREAILREAKEMKDSIIATAKTSAETEGKKMLASAKENIEREKNAAINDLKNQVAAYSIEIAEQLLRKKLESGKEQEELLNKAISKFHLN